jgi:hypothetical protein
VSDAVRVSQAALLVVLCCSAVVLTLWALK